MESKLAPPAEIRAAIRTGSVKGPTCGLARGFVQGNLAILPSRYASDFMRFCIANPKPCPLLAVSETGDPFLPTLGRDVDVRVDVPKYRIWKDGRLSAEATDIRDVWRDDLVTFVLGCSFSFEEALEEAGLEVRHNRLGCNVPMFRTTIQTTPAGRFSGPLVVTMRPYRPTDAIRAIQITSRYPSVHGAPVHIGLPGSIGITDLQAPDYGDAVPVESDEIPVFWACGVTPQAAIGQAKPDFAITHAPGSMLVTDLRNADLATN